jgi:hypothetical protein
MTEAGARDQGSDAFAARDQPESAFAHILSSLVMGMPGARGAALVDSDGETVDYAGQMEPFALRVAAAQWRIVFNQAAARKPVGRIGLVAVRAHKASYLVHGLHEGHALVVVLAAAVFDLIGWRRRLHACASALADEAGWSEGEGRDRDRTFPIVIVSDGEERPAAVRVAGVSRPLEIIGTVVGGRDRGEVAWRVRFDTGMEATLARESGGGWHADVPLGALSTDARRLGASIQEVQGGLAQGTKRVQHKGR